MQHAEKNFGLDINIVEATAENYQQMLKSYRMIAKDPKARLTTAEIKDHKWLKGKMLMRQC